MDGTYIPAIITATVALLAAIGAQFLSNWLTYRRENKKYFKEVYEKFISDYFVKILTYPRALTRLMSEEAIKEEIDLSIVIDEMFNKIHYGDKQLQSLHLDYKTQRFMEDHNEELENILQMKICYYFLIYSKDIFKKIGFKLKPNVEYRLNKTIKEYAFLSIYSEEKGHEEAKNTLIGMGRFNWNILDKYTLKDFEKLEGSRISHGIEEEWKKCLKELEN